MSVLSSTIRCGVFALRKETPETHPAAILVFADEFGSLLFCSTYTLLILFWAEVYHQAGRPSKPSPHFCFVAYTTAIYSMQICLWAFSGRNHSHQSERELSMSGMLLAMTSLSIAAGFLLYGLRLYALLKRYLIEARGRKKMRLEVGLLTSVCVPCFTARTVLEAWIVFQVCEANPQMHAGVYLVSSATVELILSALALFILRKLPQGQHLEGYYELPGPELV